MTATDEQKPDLEQLQQDLNDIIQLTQESILKKISESPTETDLESINVSPFNLHLLRKRKPTINEG